MSRDEFHDRVAKLAGQTSNPKKKVRLLPSFWERLAYPASFIGACLLGFATVAFARWLRSGAHGAGTDQASLVIEAVIGILVGVVVRQLFRIKDPLYAPANALGSTAAIMSLHNLFWWYPETMGHITTPEFVALIQAATEPNTLIFGAITFN